MPFSTSKIFGATIRESATDGSDFTNPDADYRRLFLGEDGQLHLRDSAGAVTLLGPKHIVSAGSDVSATAFANTDLTFPVAASSVYVFEMHIFFYTNATTVGIRLAINGPAGATGRWGAYVPTSASHSVTTTIAIGQNTTLDSALIATTTGPGVSPVYAIVSGSMTVAGTAGNLVLRHASETATQTVIEAGSWGRCALVS